MLPLEGETLTPDDISLFERAQAAQENRPFVPTLAPPETGSGQLPIAMPTEPAVPYVPPQAAPATATLAAPAAMPMRQPATPAGFQLGAGILQQPAQSSDPFGNLSKQQRMMLAFSAIADAGLAAQGKEGTSFARTLKAFGNMADMQRKRDAATQRQKMLQRVMGGAALPTTGMMTPQDIDARLTALTQILATNPEMAPYVNAEMQRLMPLREETIGKQKDISQKENMLMQIDNLLNDAALDQALGIEGVFRTPLADLGLDPDTKRVRTKVEQLQGGVFLQAFESLKGGGQITELEGKKAEQAMARLNTVQDPEAFREALNELRIITENGIRRLRGETVPEYTGPTQDQDPLGIRK
tara:strand:+ start:12 stop:1079 length:1068 start_codon:yes stop_codon:yes gene_type:complete